jgi:hypothetical protein
MAHLTGANIAPEGGEWGLDWCGLDWLPALVGKCPVAIAPGNPASGPPRAPIHPTPNPRHPRTEILFYIGSRK